MDPRERTQDLQVALGATLDGRQAQIWTSLPGILKGFNAEKLTCEVQPAIQGQFRNTKGVWQNQTMPLLVDCPVQFPGGGGFLMTFPLAAGDEVLVHFSARCFDAWWQQGGVQPQAQFRMHDLSDGFVAPKLYSVPNVPGGVSTKAAQLRTKDGTSYIELAPGGVINLVAPEGVNITGNLSVSGTIKGQGITDTVNNVTLNSVRVSGVQTGNDDSGPAVPGIMRYRALDANGDYAFGQGGANFLVNNPACVAQRVKTRLGLWQGTWFLDNTAGMPWLQDVIGKNTGPIYDLAIQQYILATPGVSQINGYSSTLNRATRKLTITITELVTIYGTIPFSATISAGD